MADKQQQTQKKPSVPEPASYPEADVVGGFGEPIEPGGYSPEDALEEVRDYEPTGPKAPHFDFIEGFFLISINLIVDGIEWTELTGIGIILAFLVDFIIGPITILWLWFKGVPMIGRNAVAQGVELIPGLDLLPIRTTAVVLTIIATNKPKTFDKAGFVGKVAKKVLTKGKA